LPSKSPALKEPALLQLVEGDGEDGIQSAKGQWSLSGTGFQPAPAQWSGSGSGGVRGSLSQRPWEGASYDSNDLQYAAPHPRSGVAVGAVVVAHLLLGACLLFRWCTFANWCCCAMQQEPSKKLRHGHDAERKRQQRRRKLAEQEYEKGDWVQDKQANFQEVAEDTDPLATGGDIENNRFPSTIVSSSEVKAMEAGLMEPVSGNGTDGAEHRSDIRINLEETSLAAVGSFVDANEAWVRQAEARQADEIIVMQQEDEQMLASTDHINENLHETCREESYSIDSDCKDHAALSDDIEQELNCSCDTHGEMPEQHESQLEELSSCFEAHSDRSVQQEEEQEELAPEMETRQEMLKQLELQLEELTPALEMHHDIHAQSELHHEESGMPVSYETTSFAGTEKTDEEAHQQLILDHQQQQQPLQQQKQQERVGRVRELKRQIEARSQQQVSPVSVRASSPTTAFRFDTGAAAAAAATARAQRLEEAAAAFQDTSREEQKVASFSDFAP